LILSLSLIADPAVDFFTSGFRLVDEIRQANACSIVQGNRIEKTLQERIGLFRPNRIDNVQLERRFIFGWGFAALGQLQVEGVESRMDLILRQKVQGTSGLAPRAPA
jgi:hypothetical protein